MVNKESFSYSTILSLALVLALASSLALSGKTGKVTDSINIKSILPEMSTKELKVNMKLLLTKMNLRRVPLAKARSEKLLAKLYREERIIQKQIDDLKRNLMSAGADPKARENMRVLETNRAPRDDIQDKHRNLIVLRKLTQDRIDEWKVGLANKESELDEVQVKKREAKNIIKNPESYISIPSNYGREAPEDVQEREAEILLNDRENMNYRNQVEKGEIDAPSWKVDDW